jgi:hypothetical protein
VGAVRSPSTAASPGSTGRSARFRV